jgi:hypothetical protein
MARELYSSLTGLVDWASATGPPSPSDPRQVLWAAGRLGVDAQQGLFEDRVRKARSYAMRRQAALSLRDHEVRRATPDFLSYFALISP